MRKISSLLLMMMPFLASAQEFKPYDWNNETSYEHVSDTSYSEIIIGLHIQQQYVYENQELTLYYTNHSITQVNNDKAISANNRIYIPMGQSMELVTVKARTISKAGVIKEIDQGEIKEVKDDEVGDAYKIFAIEGAEVGGQIEYFYTSKRYPKYFDRLYFQYSSPVKDISFQLSCPPNLQYEFKSYNGLAEVDVNETDSIHLYQLSASDIPALKEEPFANYNGGRKRLEFMLSYNSARGGGKLFTWEKVGKNVYGQVTTLEKNEEKVVSKVLKDIKIKQDDTEKQKLAAMEAYMKSHFFFEENVGAQASDLSFIYKNNFGTKIGLMKMAYALAKAMGVQTEVVVVPDKTKMPIDISFESYNYLTDYLLYFPSVNLFMDPYNMQSRIFMIPESYAGTDAIRVEEMKVRDFITPVVKTFYIPAEPSSANTDDMDITVSFTEDNSQNTIGLVRQFTGYQATYIKTYWPLMEQDQKDDLLKELVKFMTPDADVEEMSFTSTDFTYTNWEDPLVVNSQFKSSAFIDKAGSTLLFKVGQLIGPQSEMYQEDERQLPIENQNNRSYDRQINVSIPEGYQVQNLEDLVIDKRVKNDKGEEVYVFSSTYELKGKELVVDIIEFYDELYFPKARYEEFREVINAAADFNKIVLVVKPSK